MYSPTHARDPAVATVLQALYDAADDDSATGGQDLSRRIFPVVAVVTADGFERVAEEQLSDQVHAMVAERDVRPDGPLATTGGAA